MMELFLISLLIPIFGVLDHMLSGILQTYALKKMTGQVLPPAPVGAVLPTVAQLFEQRVKSKQGENTPTPTEKRGKEGRLVDYFFRNSLRHPSNQRFRDTGSYFDNRFSKVIQELFRKRGVGL